MGEFLKAKTKRFNSNTFLFIITIVLFIAMYVAGMIVFADKGFAKPCRCLPTCLLTMPD